MTLRHPHRWGRGRYELLEHRMLLAADVYITEFVASNSDGLLDEDGDSSDWLEIFNAGPDEVSLLGWHLTDDRAELTKWAFPAETLSVGEFLVVFASDKDRDTVGQELHTNFKLGASGEGLGLSNGNVIVSEFSPEFPQQLTDIAYGLTQDIDVRRFVDPAQTASVLISASAPPEAWTEINVDDGGWTESTAAIGYQNTVPGFTVVEAKSSSPLVNLAEANSVLNGVGRNLETVTIASVVNFFDQEGGGGTGNFAEDLPFPGNTDADDNDFAIRATGTITIPTPGVWTFGTNGDDGARLLVNNEQVIDDDTLHAPEDRFGSLELEAGQYPVEFTFFERGGGGAVELFAAAGEFESFSPDFRLIGDVAAGGLRVETSPGGGASPYGSLIQTNVIDSMFGSSTEAYLRIPFSVDDVTSIDALSLRMNYDDGFVAYLNGTEVARRNVMIDGTVDNDRPVEDAVLVEGIDFTSHIDLLNDGENVLAIHGINISADSDEFLLAAELAEFTVEFGDHAYFRTPTPGEFNPATGASEFLVRDVSIDQPAGFYEDAFEVAIAATQGTTIRYTTDGSEPTDSGGMEYTGPITVAGTTTLRARSFKSGAEPSFVETATYVFLEDVLTQSSNGQAPEGFPTSRNINGQQLDYGMDPAIVESATWGPQLMEALTQVPTMSIVMDVDDLLGTRDGIYTHAQSHGRAWERPASLELLNPDGSEGFQVNAGIRIRGGFSRTGRNPKHAFRLFFRDEYGDSKLEFPLFGDEGTDSFDKIDLRTTQNYSWAFGGDGRNTFVRDVFSRDIQGAMGQPYTRSRFYHLYINGQYWGLFQTQERSEARYAASYYGGDSDDYDVVKSAGSSGGYQTEATDGNLEALQRLADFFYQRNGLSDANMEDYFRAQGMNPDGTPNSEYERLLDVENLIDYMILTYYTSDADGPGSKFTRPRVNNYYGIFNRENPDGFKWFEHDSEHSLDTGNAARANYNMVTPLTTGGSQFRYFNPHWMHERLAETNSEYRLKFADAVHRHLFNDGLLTVDNALEVIDTRAAEIDMAIIAESARWGDAQRGTPYTKTNWEIALEDVRDWIEDRRDVVLGQLRDQGWYVDPPTFIVDGEPSEGGTVNDKLELLSISGLEFQDVFDFGAEWYYLDDGSDQGSAWREVGFDDSTWESGPAQLGYGDGDEATVVSFGSSSNSKFATNYFRRTFEFEDTQNVDAALIRLIRDDGAIVYLNGQEIARSNMASGSVSFDDFANSTASGAGESSALEFSFDPSLLMVGTNEIAVEVHQTSGTSSDLSFDLALQIGGFALSDSAIYYTMDGSDPRLSDGQVNPNAQIYSGDALSIEGTAPIATRTLKGDEWSALSVATFEAAEQGIVGDINLDGEVGFADFLILSSNFGQAGDREQGDLNGNGQIDFADFLLLSDNFGQVPQFASRAPQEPAVDVVLALFDPDDDDSDDQVSSTANDVLQSIKRRRDF